MKRKQPQNGNSIALICEYTGSSKSDNSLFAKLLQIALISLGSVAAIMTFISCFKITVIAPIVISVTVSAVILQYVLQTVFNKKPLLISLSFLGVWALAFLIFFDSLLNGVLMGYDQAMTTVFTSMHWKWIPIYDSYSALPVTAAASLLGIAVASLLTYFTISRLNLFGQMLTIAPFFLFPAVFSIVPDYIYFAMYIGYVAGAIAYHRSNTRKVKKTSGRKRVKAKNKYTKGKFAGSAVIVSAVVILVFFAGQYCLSLFGISRTVGLNDFRKDLVYSVEDVIDYITGFDRDGSMREGKLYNVGTRQIKDRHYFTLEISTTQVKNSLYYKGFSGAVYDNNEWKQIDSYDNYQALFNRLEETKISIPSIQGELISQNKNAGSANYVMSTITNLRRKKDYTYNVYFTNYDPEGFSAVYDQYMQPRDKNGYILNSYTDTEKLYLIQSGVYHSEGFQNTWQQYCDFVHKEYINSNASDELKSLVNSLNLTDMAGSVDRVRSYLAQHTETENKTVNVKNGEDFIDQFLFETGEGYCTHYATTAVVMLQAKGIPARYCEGYLITPNRFKEYAVVNAASGFSTINVTDRFAHAWVEVFDDNYGWIPVDVTPGFYSTSFENQMQNLKNKTGGTTQVQEEEIPSSGEDQELLASDTPDQIVDQELTQLVDKNEEEQGGTKVFLWVILALLLLVIADIIWLFATILIRRALMYNRDRQKALKYTYRYFVKLLKFEKIDITKVSSYQNAVDVICEKSIYCKKQDLMPVCEIILKNGYSKEGVEIKDLDAAIVYVVNYAKGLLKGLRFSKKLRFIFISHLPFLF